MAAICPAPSGQPCDQLVQLLVTTRRRQGRPPDVVGDVEVAIVDPHRPGQAQFHFLDFLTIARYLRQPLFDGFQQCLVAQSGTRTAQDQQQPDIHWGGCVLQLIEGGVRCRQPGDHYGPVLLVNSSRRVTSSPTLTVSPTTSRRGYTQARIVR